VTSNDLEIRVKAKDVNASDTFKKVEADAEKSGRGIGNSFSKIGPALKMGAAGAAVAVGGALMSGISAAMDKEAVTDKLDAQLGASEGVAKHAGEVAGNLYNNAFGESMEDAANAVKSVLQAGVVGKNATKEELEKTTERAMNLATVMEVDVSEASRAAGVMMKNGLAKNATEAFDIITKATQNGMNVSGDLLDTITEYSPQFKALGMDGTKSMGMIQQAMKAGARDTDFAADAIKEFAIRSKDGSTLSAQAYKDLGMNADEMFKTFAEGGPEADRAMGHVLDRIREIEDPVKRSQTAVALFGTKAEDLQDALFAIDPATAVDAFGKVGGAADKMGDTLNDNAKAKIESFKRKSLDTLARAGANVITFFEDVADNPAVKNFMAAAGETIRKRVIPAIRSLWNWVQEKVVPAFQEFYEKHITRVKKELDKLSKTFDDNKGELRQLWNTFKGIVDFWATRVLPVGLRLYGFLAGTLIGGIRRAISAVISIVGAFIRFRNTVASVRDSVVSRMSSMVSYVASIPGRIRSRISNAFDGFKSAASSAAAGARGILNGLVSWAGGIPGRIKSRVLGGLSGFNPLSAIPGFAHGGIVGGAATGGPRSGLQWVGEQGRELVRLAPGSTVIPHGQSENMAAQASGQGGAMVLELHSGGSRLDELILELIRRAVRVRGGNVQTVLGR
jgi:phage-related minor tail protein